MKNYDKIILEHYKQVASESGDSHLSTMSHEFIREMETKEILSFITYLVEHKNISKSATIADVGCGNGFSLQIMSKSYPDFNYIGYEYTPELLEIAASRFQDTPNVKVLQADIRDSSQLIIKNIDVLFCQRVLINLLDINDQKTALINLASIVKPGGYLFFIETLQSGLDNINAARKEFDLVPLPPAHHNLNLPDDFFEIPDLLQEVNLPDKYKYDNFLSSYYYVARVFHPLVLGDRPFSRDSHFVKFFTQGLSKNIEEKYSPLRIKIMQRK